MEEGQARSHPLPWNHFLTRPKSRSVESPCRSHSKIPLLCRLQGINVIKLFIERANANYPTIKFTIEVSEIETTFLDTTVYKGKRFEKKESSMCVHILSLQKHFSTHTQQLSPSGR